MDETSDGLMYCNKCNREIKKRKYCSQCHKKVTNECEHLMLSPCYPIDRLRHIWVKRVKAGVTYK